jgi:hypothetical protein
VVEDTPLLSQSPEERPPTWQSACRRRGELLRRILFFLFSFFPVAQNDHGTRRKARMVNSDQFFRSVGNRQDLATCALCNPVVFTSAGGG